MSEANLLFQELGKDNYYIRVGYDFFQSRISSGKISARKAEITYRYYVSHGTVKRVYSESAKSDYLLLMGSSHKSILFTETVFKTFVRAHGRFYYRQVLQKILEK
nr:MAG TPA: hypothetical protein [Caudoviricetes sp.]